MRNERFFHRLYCVKKSSLFCLFTAPLRPPQKNKYQSNVNGMFRLLCYRVFFRIEKMKFLNIKIEFSNTKMEFFSIKMEFLNIKIEFLNKKIHELI